jgi:hypothetical protein
MRDITVFSGGAHPVLADSVCDILGIDRSPGHDLSIQQRLPRGTTGRELPRERRILIQPLVPPVRSTLWSCC